MIQNTKRVKLPQLMHQIMIWLISWYEEFVDYQNEEGD